MAYKDGIKEEYRKVTRHDVISWRTHQVTTPKVSKGKSQAAGARRLSGEIYITGSVILGRGTGTNQRLHQDI